MQVSKKKSGYFLALQGDKIFEDIAIDGLGSRGSKRVITSARSLRKCRPRKDPVLGKTHQNKKTFAFVLSVPLTFTTIWT